MKVYIVSEYMQSLGITQADSDIYEVVPLYELCVDACNVSKTINTFTTAACRLGLQS